MSTLALIRDQLRMTDEALTAITADLGDHALLSPTGRGGNHPLWIVGHLAFVEGAVRSVVTGQPNPVERWKALFDQGSVPVRDAAAYPPLAELLAEFHGLRAGNLALLEELGEAGLLRAPVFIPPGFEKEMRTVGHALSLLCIHQMVHYGQLSVVRRAAGLAPLR